MARVRQLPLARCRHVVRPGARRGVLGLAISFAVLACGAGASPGPSASPGSTPQPTYRQTLSEFLLAVTACLQDKGYQAHVDDQGGGVVIDGSTDPAATSADTRACVEAVDPARLQPPPPLTADQLLELYRYVVAQAECMRKAGYPVSDPPPFQVWVDSGQAFDPYIDLRNRGVDFDHADLVRCQAVDERPTFLDQ